MERKRSIIRHVQHIYKEDITEWINQLDEREITLIDEHLYDVNSLDDLKLLIK